MKQDRIKRGLDQYRAEIDSCVRCGTCKATCPPYVHKREESISARGRMALIQAVLDGKLSASDIFRDRLATCVGCLACRVSCPRGIPVPEIIQEAKEYAAADLGPDGISRIIFGIMNHDLLLRGFSRIAPALLYYANVAAGRSGGIPASPAAGSFLDTVPEFPVAVEHCSGRRPRVALFVGCMSNYFQQDIARSTVAILDHLGFDVFIPRDQRCCGRPYLSLGNRTALAERAVQNARVFAPIKADAIVTACASCGLTFKKEYPKLLPPEMGFPAVLDIHELLFLHLGNHRILPVDATVTYHEPCHLGRGQGLSGTMRNVLRSIPGITLIDMKHPDQCCGLGGVMRITHHELSSRIADAKVREILATGAPVVATGCPGCRMQIQDGLERAGSNVRVMHTVQILEKALANTEHAMARKDKNR